MIEMRTIETGKNSVTDITEEVMAILEKSGVKDGLLTVEVPHSTAGVVATSHFDPKVRIDIMKEVKRLVPSRITFAHEESPDDAAGHIKCALFGNSICSIVKDGKLVNDNVLHYFFMEYDGPRSRKYFVSVIGDK